MLITSIEPGGGRLVSRLKWCMAARMLPAHSSSQHHTPLLQNGALVEGDELFEGVVIEFGEPGFVGPDDRPGQLFLVLDHLVDALL